MFQSFIATTSPDTVAPRLDALRASLAQAGVQAFLIPRADAHRGETVPPSEERLAWLTSFTGSAGMAAVTAARAVLFVDGRYTLQSRAQTDTDAVELRAIPRDKLSDWLVEALSSGDTVGFDPWLHTRKEVEALRTALAAKGIALAPVANLVDAAWTDRPAPPAEPMRVHPLEVAGEPHQDKRAALALTLKEAGVAAMVLSLPDSIAWLLNIRGADIARMPVALGFALLQDDGRVTFFTDATDPDGTVAAHLGDEVTLAPRAAFSGALAQLSGPVGVDEATAPQAVGAALADAGVEVRWTTDPCILPKACKTQAELAGIRAAHRRDAVAMIEFLAWLDANAPGGGLTEIDVVRELESRRRATNALQDISFETICGAGPNGAIVHYRVTEGSNRAVEPGQLLLIDSGGQYLDGTTDITRTVAIGPVPEEARRPFTLVLQGMVRLSMARWPDGTTGRDLDTLVRAGLWRAGLDFDHGTGHGVGAYLGVHEGPQSISRRGDQELRPGMVVSNEPGYYREGAFGIRIENLVAVRPAEVPEGGDRAMMEFETLTFVPIDRRLIDASFLTAEEIGWVDEYHSVILGAFGPVVSEAARNWLTAACAPL